MLQKSWVLHSNLKRFEVVHVVGGKVTVSVRSSTITVAVIAKSGMIEISPRILGLDSIIVWRPVLDIPTIRFAIRIDRCKEELKHGC